MIDVKVDGQNFTADMGSVGTMGDLVELVKASIDPDTIITQMVLEGKPLADDDWRSPLHSHGSATLEIATGEKEKYLLERMATAESYLAQIIEEFSQVAGDYSDGKSDEANTMLAVAVDDLLAFVNWYLTLLSVEPVRMQTEIEAFNVHIMSTQEICQQLLQQQMFQSWWALGETIGAKLIPELESLKQFCEANSTKITLTN